MWRKQCMIQRANTILCTRPGKQNRASSHHLPVGTVKNTTRASSSHRSGDLDPAPITRHSYSTLAYPVSLLHIVANIQSITHNTTRKFCACPFVFVGCSDHPFMSSPYAGAVLTGLGDLRMRSHRIVQRASAATRTYTGHATSCGFS